MDDVLVGKVTKSASLKKKFIFQRFGTGTFKGNTNNWKYLEIKYTHPTDSTQWSLIILCCIYKEHQSDTHIADVMKVNYEQCTQVEYENNL